MKRPWLSYIKQCFQTQCSGGFSYSHVGTNILTRSPWLCPQWGIRKDISQLQGRSQATKEVRSIQDQIVSFTNDLMSSENYINFSQG